MIIVTGAEFKKVVDFYGEANILSIGFDNSASTKVFTDEHRFSLKNFYQEEIECLQFIEFDRHGNPYHVVKHVENIQTIIVKDDGLKLNDYDHVTIRG